MQSARRPLLRPLHAPIALLSVMVVGLAGCSGNTEDAGVKVARADVALKQRAVVQAQDKATAAAAAFCTTSASYITAIDRYGDLLTATAPTVGDVVTAGSDLEEPSAQAVSAGQEVTKTTTDLATAESDLAAAEQKLAAAEATAAGQTPASASPTPSASATQQPASVGRVQQAEAQFAAAQKGISEQTPLAQASEQFNSAAVALEVAWLQLFSDAKCLDDAKQKDAIDAVAAYTTALQQQLTDAGYYDAKVDGVYGPATVDAVQALQKANGLPQTGTMDKATEKALGEELSAAGGAAAQEETASTAAVQQTLKLAGYWDGPVDGQWTDELTDALMKFQTDLGVEATGTVDAATVAAVEKAIATAGTSPSAKPSPPSASPSASASS